MVRSMRALRLALDSRRGRRTWASAVVAARVRVAIAKATARCCMFFLKPDIKDRSCWNNSCIDSVLRLCKLRAASRLKYGPGFLPSTLLEHLPRPTGARDTQGVK